MKYTISEQIRYRSNYNRVSVYLQADLTHITRPSDIFPDLPYTIRMMSDSDEDLRTWLDVLNDSYSIYNEKPIELSQSKTYLEQHPFLDIRAVYFLLDNTDCIGSITVGVYKENPSVGGVSRIAIRRSYMRKGLGKYITAYAYEQLLNVGVRYGQSIVMIKRESSLITHFKLGFHPQLNPKYKVYNNQKRFFFVRARAYWYVSGLYNRYRQQLSENFHKE